MWQSSGTDFRLRYGSFLKGATGVWREAQQLINEQSSMVAFCYANVRACQSAPPAGEHVQLVDGWSIR